MISLLKVQEIERLIAAGGLSQRKIAQQTGVSRATVSGIAAGTRPDYVALRNAREQSPEEPQGPLVRCGDCGGRVYAPCRLCRIRRLMSEESQLRVLQPLQPADGDDEPAERPAPESRPVCSLGPQPRLAG